ARKGPDDVSLLRKRGARVRRLSMCRLRNLRLHHLQLSRSHPLQIMPSETTRAATDAGQVDEDRLAGALSESVTAIAAIAAMIRGHFRSAAPYATSTARRESCRWARSSPMVRNVAPGWR